jgi:archaeal cell division control protein 6
VTPKVRLEDIIAMDNSLFKNKQVLKPNYTLKGIDDVLHRDDEIKVYYEYLKDIFRGVSPSNVFIYGKPGLGKTLITKLVLDEVEQEAKNRGIDLCIININCDEIRTEHAILQKIVQDVPTDEPRRALGNSRDKHNEYLKYLINHYQGIIVFVLDELDKADNPEMINKIIRTESTTSGQFPTVIGITNDIGLRDRFPPHLKSVLCENDLIIKPYDADQLRDIIQARVDIAFKEGTVDEIVIALCAAYAAQDYGDVRRAIDILRVAGELAESRCGNSVEEHDVRDAHEKLERDKAIEVIKTLPTQSKMVLLSCIYVFDSLKENITANIYETYQKIAYSLDADVLTQRRVTDLISELNQLGIIEGFNEFRGRKGRKKVITKISSKEHALKTLYEDDNINDISNIHPSVYLR